MVHSSGISLVLVLAALQAPQAQRDELSPRTRAMCDSVAAWLVEIPAAKVDRINRDPVYDRTADRTYPGCAVSVRGAWREVEGAPDPLKLVERLDDWFSARDWQEDPGLLADGPGSGSRGFVRDRLLCVRSAVWGGGWEGDMLDSYQMRISCADRGG